MTIDALIILAGALIALFAVLPRFPEPWQTLIFLVLGVAVIALGIILRRQEAAPASDVHRGPTEMTHE